MPPTTDIREPGASDHTADGETGDEEGDEELEQARNQWGVVFALLRMCSMIHIRTSVVGPMPCS